MAHAGIRNGGPCEGRPPEGTVRCRHGVDDAVPHSKMRGTCQRRRAKNGPDLRRHRPAIRPATLISARFAFGVRDAGHLSSPREIGDGRARCGYGGRGSVRAMTRPSSARRSRRSRPARDRALLRNGVTIRVLSQWPLRASGVTAGLAHPMLAGAIRGPGSGFGNIMQRLKDKTCVITGAARGIGRAIAARFHDEGALVVVTDIDEANGADTAAQIGCRFEPLDVREEGDWSRLAEVVPVADVVVNNAGVTGFETGMAAHDPEHASLADWRAVHRVNLDGTFLGCRYAIGAMKASGAGSIINISSRSGLVGIPGAAAYASSKAAIRNHSKTVALYCAQQGWQIRCNSIHPAAILTPIWEPMLG